MAQPISSDAPPDPGAERAKPLLRHPFRRKKLAPRPLSIQASAILALLAAQPTAASLAAGFSLVAAGLVLRLWATGHLRKTDELTVSGPYAFLRHPLYAGALVMGTGFAVMAGPRVAAVALPLGFAFFFLYYLPRKARRRARRGVPHLPHRGSRARAAELRLAAARAGADALELRARSRE